MLAASHPSWPAWTIHSLLDFSPAASSTAGACRTARRHTPPARPLAAAPATRRPGAKLIHSAAPPAGCPTVLTVPQTTQSRAARSECSSLQVGLVMRAGKLHHALGGLGVAARRQMGSMPHPHTCLPAHLPPCWTPTPGAQPAPSTCSPDMHSAAAIKPAMPGERLWMSCPMGCGAW